MIAHKAISEADAHCSVSSRVRDTEIWLDMWRNPTLAKEQSGDMYVQISHIFICIFLAHSLYVKK